MTLSEFEKRFFNTLGTNYKTKDVDAFNRQLMRENADISCLEKVIGAHEEYYRTYFQINLLRRKTKEEKMQFIEQHFDLLHDWWHIDSIVSFLGDSLDFAYAFQKASEYVSSDQPYVRRLGYVLFIPRLVRDQSQIEPIFSLFQNDTVHHVVMAQAWLLSYLAMCDANRTYAYLRDCDLHYNIVGKAIQKICDSYVISQEDKMRFKALRPSRKII